MIFDFIRDQSYSPELLNDIETAISDMKKKMQDIKDEIGSKRGGPTGGYVRGDIYIYFQNILDELEESREYALLDGCDFSTLEGLKKQIDVAESLLGEGAGLISLTAINDRYLKLLRKEYARLQRVPNSPSKED